MSSSQWKSCAEVSEAEAPRMKRGQMFARVVLSGLSCVNQEGAARWTEPARRTLEPLAAEAIALPSTLRDHRFQLYQQLMSDAGQRGDRATVLLWGNRWLHELDASRPANDDERTALDVARVDAASILGEPLRVLPALIASERAMPGNYNASLRLAQVAADAGRYDEALAACDRGLAHVSGPLGRTWLLRTKADAFRRKGKPADARRMLSEALRVAQTIGIRESRQRNVDAIRTASGRR